MNDELETRPITTVIETTPDTPQEGEPMPLTLEMLNTQIMILRVEVDALKQRFETLIPPQQITAMYERVEKLIDDAMKRFGQIEFSVAKVEAMHESMQKLIQLSEERGKSQEFSNRALSSLLGYDIGNPTAPRIGLSIFEVINQSNETADSAAQTVDAIREEMAQYRFDSVQTLSIAKQITEYHAKNEAVLTAVVQNAQRWKGLQDAIQKVISDPRILIPALTALGGGGVAIAKLIEVLF